MNFRMGSLRTLNTSFDRPDFARWKLKKKKHKTLKHHVRQIIELCCTQHVYKACRMIGGCPNYWGHQELSRSTKAVENTNCAQLFIQLHSISIFRTKDDRCGESAKYISWIWALFRRGNSVAAFTEFSHGYELPSLHFHDRMSKTTLYTNPCSPIFGTSTDCGWKYIWI